MSPAIVETSPETVASVRLMLPAVDERAPEISEPPAPVTSPPASRVPATARAPVLTVFATFREVSVLTVRASLSTLPAVCSRSGVLEPVSVRALPVMAPVTPKSESEIVTPPSLMIFRSPDEVMAEAVTSACNSTSPPFVVSIVEAAVMAPLTVILPPVVLMEVSAPVMAPLTVISPEVVLMVVPVPPMELTEMAPPSPVAVSCVLLPLISPPTTMASALATELVALLSSPEMVPNDRVPSLEYVLSSVVTSPKSCAPLMANVTPL